MAGTITMQKMRYINSLNQVSRVRTSRCFVYNNTIFFAVPREFVSKAIGTGAKNIRTLQDIFSKRVKIIIEPAGNYDAERFIRSVVDPVQFKSLEEKEDHFVLNAGSRNKAALIGRNKRRLIELSQIMIDNFGKALRIV
ncbi:hypothetical protein CO038_00500 [Candidatus Pacearchaeota archaeon CG_4_9_14_0_2_um_filter_39_13]|nr:hypothetical protein [Candidatus Pacearchaeota archaeon]OIO42968.1 MAG: hypothetical protein AUJ64_03285 [Candidatus Pacearchaeota archaeon CG1_02_39_14]PJC45036.1 MAG: hypothetical protein CO038_00500 [Candidatus Pacearchaeota archaeon CG_4_9_14_0_2_um_filter_39_13]